MMLHGVGSWCMLLTLTAWSAMSLPAPQHVQHGHTSSAHAHLATSASSPSPASPLRHQLDGCAGMQQQRRGGRLLHTRMPHDMVIEKILTRNLRGGGADAATPERTNSLENLLAGLSVNSRRLASGGTQFTYFTSTKVQILTQIEQLCIYLGSCSTTHAAGATC